MSAFARDDSRPTTPTGPPRTHRTNGTMRALNTNTPRQETFFDDATPVDNVRDSRPESEPGQLRDSHDLSFVEGGNLRDSVVDNMLLSLDQFSTGNMFSGTSSSSRREDESFYIRDNSYRPPGSRNRGHTYTTSGSSDYDLYDGESTPQFPSHSRARRSNSSNNIASPTSRSGSARDPYARRQANSAYGQYQQTAHMRGGASKGSKSSGSSSMDFGQTGVLGTHRLGFGKRSASFDHSNRLGLQSVNSDSVLDRGRTAYMNYDQDYDAAPEPTIPAGPRRAQPQPQPQLQSNVAPAAQQSVYAPSIAPVPRRRGSVRSNTSYRTLKKGKSQLEPSMRAVAQEFVNASTLRDMPSVPAFQEATAPAPTVGTRKLLFGSQDPPAKERPGFFRRVFGGGSSKAQAQTSQVSTTASIESPQARPADIDSIYSNNRPRTTPSNNTHVANQLKSLPKVPQTSAARPNEMQSPVPPVLAKKPSSFFRRRKKSVSEMTKPPVMSLDFAPPPKPFIPAQPSPSVNSLRQAMNPYLVESPSAHERFYDMREQRRIEGESNGEHPHGFSPGYKPHKDAIVRTVRPDSRTASPSPSSRSEDERTSEVKKPKLKLKVKHGRPAPISITPQEDTFLADSSSCNEDRSGRASPVHEPSGVGETQKSSPGPTPSSPNQNAMEGTTEPEACEAQPELLTPNARLANSGSTSRVTLAVEEEGWVVTTPTQDDKTARGRNPSARRIWLDTTAIEDSPVEGADSLQLPLEGARSTLQPQELSVPVTPDVTSPSSPIEVFHSATSLPIVQIETRDSDSTMPSIVEDRSMHSAPTDADRERALKIYSGNETALLKSQAATILGDMTLSSARIRRAFMDLFDWAGFTILAAMRDMCGKLVLKAETQQVDRILMSLSERWCECNPNHGFKEVDVVHTLCYSILLLNTDLHVADIETRMTRSQFVKNTLPTVTRVCRDAGKAEETLRPKSTHFRRGSLPWNDKSEPTTPNAEQTTFSAETSEEPVEGKRARSRLSIRPPLRSGSDGILSFDSVGSESHSLVNTPYNGPMKGWELQIEIVLKEFYESIRKERLPLHGVSNLQHQPSNNNLSVAGVLRRTPSVLSKAPSDTTSYRGRPQTDYRSVGARWASKNRSKQRLYPASTVASSRTSLDDTSVWSPAGSSTWSRYSYGKGTSMSVDSLGSHFATGDYQQAIGFANALSQAIIREEGMTIASDEDFARAAPLLEDESLELVGAPWAKEGILKHKHHLETVDRKAKDRNWSENFAVIEKGYMRLFSFSMNSKSARMKSKAKPAAGGIVGGGNWMDNAEALEVFPLRQTIASALPPPGYSKTRPHVWALSLPTGAVHLFQVGTPDIVREFVSTANYWSARLSKEPLTGGVSSMEYGWGENVINPALLRQDSNPSVPGHMPRPSVASSLRSSMDHATGTPRARLPGDKVVLSDWSPPTASMMASNLMEVDQLRALTDYVKNIEAELAYHNELRAPLLITFSPRHPNASKAMANWERKSQYLLREIVKFRTYIDTLTLAQTQKEKIYAERETDGESRPTTKDGAAESSPSDEVDGASEVPTASVPTNA